MQWPGLEARAGRNEKFSEQGIGPTRGPRRETSKHQAGAGLTTGRPGKSMQFTGNPCRRAAWRGRPGLFTRNCSQRVSRERRGEMEAIHQAGSSSRRGRSALVAQTADAVHTPMPSTAPMVVHTTHAFHALMPPTAPRPLYTPMSPTAPRPAWPEQSRLSVASMFDLPCAHDQPCCARPALFVGDSRDYSRHCHRLEVQLTT
jgi:hypothetical protein